MLEESPLLIMHTARVDSYHHVVFRLVHWNVATRHAGKHFPTVFWFYSTPKPGGIGHLDRGQRPRRAYRLPRSQVTGKRAARDRRNLVERLIGPRPSARAGKGGTSTAPKLGRKVARFDVTHAHAPRLTRLLVRCALGSTSCRMQEDGQATTRTG